MHDDEAGPSMASHLVSRLTSAFSSANVSRATTPAHSAPASGQSTPGLGSPVFKPPPPPIDAKAAELLRGAGVVLTSCSDCTRPCDAEEDGENALEIDVRTLRAWSKQEIDMSASTLMPMLGANKPFLHHCLISTNGARDWVRDVSSIEGGLVQLLGEVKTPSKASSNGAGQDTTPPKLPNGCWQTDLTSSPTRHLCTASSAHSPSDQAGQGSIMLFPDWLVLTDIPSAEEGPSAERKAAQTKVQATYDAWIAPGAPLLGAVQRVRELESPEAPRMRRWVLPYRAVVVLCSHKKRDVRCHLAATMLAQGIRAAAERAGWSVDERGDTIGCSAPTSKEAPARASDGAPKGRGWGFVDEEADDAESQVRAWRKRAAQGRGPEDTGPAKEEENDDGTGTLGMFFCSHIGGHKYSGNCIIYFPNGAGVWYGRVDPLKDSSTIFNETILNGKVISEFLRAGINLWRGPLDASSSQPSTRVSGTAVEMQRGGLAPGLLRW